MSKKTNPAGIYTVDNSKYVWDMLRKKEMAKRAAQVSKSRNPMPSGRPE